MTGFSGLNKCRSEDGGKLSANMIESGDRAYKGYLWIEVECVGERRLEDSWDNDGTWTEGGTWYVEMEKQQKWIVKGNQQFCFSHKFHMSVAYPRSGVR